MKIQFSASNALNKWLRADLPRLPHEVGKQAGVNTLVSTSSKMCWQVHIIDNHYQSFEKTIILCEANSRFVSILPVDDRLSLDELTLLIEQGWQTTLVETLFVINTLPKSDVLCLLSELSEKETNISWVKNTDRSINGHITDAGQWVTQLLRDNHWQSLPDDEALNLAIYLNTQQKRFNKRKEKCIPIERFYEYCHRITE